MIIEDSKISFSIFKNVILLGVASFIMRITESFINIVFNNQLIRYGGLEYVAVHSSVGAAKRAMSVSDILAQCFAVSIFIPFYKNKLSNLK